MLSRFDDYPLHQVLEPLRLVGTTDRNFYDRYYFNVHNCSDEVAVVAGLGCYPNRGVVDAFVAARHDGIHRVVRASRTLGADRSDTSVGPIAVEVVEGLRTLRLTCAAGAGEVSLDLTWTGGIAAHAEPRHRLMRDGRTLMDMCRFIQTGTWQGSLTVGDRTFSVTPESWWGVRDRSWGVRSIGEPDGGGIDAATPPAGFLWNWVPMQFADKTVVFAVQEDSEGARSVDHGVLIPLDPRREVENLGAAEHDWTFVPGTRQLSGGRIAFPHSRGELTHITVEPLLPMYLGLGTGYGGEVAPQPGLSEWRHGMYQGELVVETPSWNLADIPADRLLNVVTDHIARFTTNTGEVGYGMAEYLFVGPNRRYGFLGFTDGAL
jgi:hypothetical protein